MRTTEYDPRGLDILSLAPMRDRVTDALRETIISGAFGPGTRLNETDLAQRFGVSRSPVREAIQVLVHEGLIRQLPYRRAEVVAVSPEEMAEVLIPLRVLLETFAFRRARTAVTERDVWQLCELIERMRLAGLAGNYDEIVRADVAFHERVIECAGRPHCLQIWRSIQPRVRAYLRADISRHQAPEAVADAHKRLLDALFEPEEKLVVTLQQHIRDGLSLRVGMT